jgi:hypothetical protein
MNGGRGTARAALGVLFALTAACSEHAAPKVVEQRLPPGVVAAVGEERIAAGTVARIAARAGAAPLEARRRAIDDALFATATRQNPALAARVRVAERGVLARALLERLRDDAQALGPPTDEEVSALTARRWPELDRPPSAGTSHAVVLVKTPADDAPARALANELAAALKDVKTGVELVKRAQAFPARGLEIRAERLPPVTPDGRLWDPSERPPKPLDGTFDLDFARAANALATPGERSAVIKSAFGYHVILLDVRYPELRVPLAERRVLLAGDVFSERAKRSLDALLGPLRAASPVSIDRAVDALTALVPAAP